MQKTLAKIMDVMDEIEYGFKDKDGKNILTLDPKRWDEEFDDFYYLQTPEELLNTKCGVCWEQVELERFLFQKSGIDTKTYFIYIVEDDMLPSHTFLTFEQDGKFCWFEHSWATHKGIHEYESIRELLQDVKEKFKESHKEVSENSPLYIYEYQKPTEHITCNEFYKYIETQKLV